MVIAMIGPTSSCAPWIAASSGVRPSSMWRWMFSTTTMASSTTSPMASTIASRVRRLMVKPKASISAQAPTSERGMATRGMTTERTEPRKR